VRRIGPGALWPRRHQHAAAAMAGDTAAVRRRLDRLEAERRLLAEGRRAAGPTVAECWPFPHGGNRRA